VISDGGIRFSGDIAKAIAAGAHAVMIGGPVRRHRGIPRRGRALPGRLVQVVSWHGLPGRHGERHGSADRYFQDAATELEKLVPEGVEGRVPYKGSVVTILHQLAGGLRAAMGYTGSSQHRRHAHAAGVCAHHQLAGVRESHVHDVSITKEAPNYRGILTPYVQCRGSPTSDPRHDHAALAAHA
jgi:IMP dehydrogenase